MIQRVKKRSLDKKKEAIVAAVIALNEASDEYLKVKNITTHVNTNTKVICTLNPNKTPKVVATPFPPLNLIHIGNICPNTAKIAAYCCEVETHTAINPFRESMNKAKAASVLLPVLKTFVVPIFPEPILLRSIP